MKTAVAQVYDVLKPRFKDIPIYTNRVPDEVITKPKLPLIRIVELQGDYTNEASNIPHAITFYVQVDLWVSTLQEVDAYYFLIDEIMRDSGWGCTYTEQTDDTDLPKAKRIIKRYVATLNL